MKFFICLLVALLAVANASVIRSGYGLGGVYGGAYTVDRVVRVIEPAPVVHRYSQIVPVVHHVQHVQHVQPHVHVVKVVEPVYAPASIVKVVQTASPVYGGIWKKK